MTNQSIAKGALFASVAAVLVGAAEAPARSSVPIEPDAVLAHVPARETRSASLELARSYLALARRDGDPRFLGLAEGVLNQLPVDRELRVLRATILQSRHDFSAALAELDAVLREGEHAQARLTQATILTVRADYARARESCRALPPSSYAVACEASIDALTGQPERARTALEALLRRAGAERAWLLSLLGELAYWQGDDARAERELRASLALEDDRYTRALLADLQLDRGRTEDVACDDLRAALAELARGHAGVAVARIDASIAEARARGDRVHLREEARLALARGHRDEALALARENWRVQREPWDARVFLQAARTPAEAEPVRAWREQAALPRLEVAP